VFQSFQLKKNRKFMPECAWALDGLLLLIHRPTREEAANVRIYHSFHYQKMGLHVQEMVAFNLQFMSLAVLVGGSSEVQVYHKSVLVNGLKAYHHCTTSSYHR
jgi:hypothetical protein